MIIKLIRIKNDLLKKKLRKFSKFKEILKIFLKIWENCSNFKEIFLNVYIFAYYFQIIFITNYVSNKIEGHVPPQSTAAKNWEVHVPQGSPERLWLTPPPISKANFAYACPPKNFTECITV